MLGNDCFLTAVPVMPAIRRRLAAYARQEQHTLVAAIEDACPGREHVLVRHIAPRPWGGPFDAPQLRASVGGIAARVTGAQLPIEANIEKLIRVLPDQRALTGREIDAIEVMPARIAVVDLDGDFPRSVQRPQAELSADVRERREVTHGVRNRIDNKQVTVLVSRLVVEK